MPESGVCALKPEYIVEAHVREVVLDSVSESDKQKINCDDAQNADNDEPAAKVQKLSKKEKKKLSGQNKSRPAPFRVDRQTQLCNNLINVAENEEEKECTNEKCVFLHDAKQYLDQKPKDIGDVCYNFETLGRCPRGLACRFGSSHISSEGFNKVNAEKYDVNRKPSTINNLTYDLMLRLRKRKYDFSLTTDVISRYDNEKKNKGKDANSQQKSDKISETKDALETEEKKHEVVSEECDDNLPSDANGEIVTKSSGVVTDEDLVKIRKCEKKKIDWSNKLYLSPLTTVGNLPFRRICKEYGADITCGEMAMCSSLLQGLSQEWALVKRHESENLFGVQLCGNNPHIIGKTAQMLQENADIDFIDINLGCPIDLVYREGAGSGLLRRQHVLGSVVRCTSDILNIPLTLKTRTGVYSTQNIAHTLIPKFRDWGASLVTLHGRSREQRYTRMADWPYINECASLAAPMPLFGNGDILSYEDYSYVKENYKNVTGVMIGRGALIKPWIFTEIKEQKLWDISSSERFDIIKKYVNYGLEHWGSDTKGVENTRRFLLEWLSFLYRYIPVGILERPPQKINERPPSYRGRDDLETLMASPSCADWIKISEMLLGPVPEYFRFLPKHKANSYK